MRHPADLSCLICFEYVHQRDVPYCFNRKEAKDHGEGGITLGAPLQGRVLIILNFPSHNPTGYSLNAAEWSDVTDVLVRASEQVPVTVLMDCAYLKFGGDAIDAWDAALPRLLEATTVLFAWTASKAFTQYGLRVGALIACHRDADERVQLTFEFATDHPKSVFLPAARNALDRLTRSEDTCS